MVRTYGLTHIALAVRDAERSLAFYQQVIGVVSVCRDGRVLRRGEFCPGEPYVFFEDPDGYEVELWHELPTPVDPVTG